MKKKKLIFICIIALLIFGGCVQQLSNDTAFSGFTPAPVVNDEKLPNETILPPDTENSKSDELKSDEGSPSAINGQEDNPEKAGNSLGNPNENSENEAPKNEALTNNTLDETIDEKSNISALSEIPYEKRVYFANVSEPDYEFNSGLYTEQDLRLLSIMFQLIPSDTVNGVLKAFDSSVDPDINLTQFTRDDFADWRYSVSIDNAVTYYKDEGLALLSVKRALNNTGIEYLLVFGETSDGHYSPLSVICMNPADGLLQAAGRIIIANGDRRYLLTTGQISDIETEKLILTRLYDCDTGKLVFSLPYKFNSYREDLNENYSVELKMDKIKNYTDGFTIIATAKAEHTVMDKYITPNGINLLLEQDITIFVSGVSAYVEDSSAAFFANFARVKPWQYKTVFKEALIDLKKNGSTLVAQWATDMLNYDRNIAESSKLPEHELDLLKYGSSDEPHMHFTADDLYGIVSSTRNKEYSSLTGVLQNYSTSDNYDLSKFLQLKKFKWSRVSGNVECKLIFPDINMNYVLMEAKFNYRKKAVTVLLLLSGEENNSYYALADVQTTTIGEGDSLYYSASDDLLKLSLPSAEYAKATNSCYYFGGELALEILTGYTGPSGLYYTISLERDNMNGSLYYCSVNAYLSSDAKAAVYELPVCFESNGSFTNDIDALKLLRGKPEEHEAFKLLLHDSLDKIAKSDYYHIEYRTEAENVLKYFGWL